MRLLVEGNSNNNNNNNNNEGSSNNDVAGGEIFRGGTGSGQQQQQQQQGQDQYQEEEGYDTNNNNNDDNNNNNNFSSPSYAIKPTTSPSTDAFLDNFLVRFPVKYPVKFTQSNIPPSQNFQSNLTGAFSFVVFLCVLRTSYLTMVTMVTTVRYPQQQLRQPQQQLRQPTRRGWSKWTKTMMTMVVIMKKTLIKITSPSHDERLWVILGVITTLLSPAHYHHPCSPTT